jgi:hypothetical protein
MATDSEWVVVTDFRLHRFLSVFGNGYHHYVIGTTSFAIVQEDVDGEHQWRLSAFSFVGDDNYQAHTHWADTYGLLSVTWPTRTALLRDIRSAHQATPLRSKPCEPNPRLQRRDGVYRIDGSDVLAIPYTVETRGDFRWIIGRKGCTDRRLVRLPPSSTTNLLRAHTLVARNRSRAYTIV